MGAELRARARAGAAPLVQDEALLAALAEAEAAGLFDDWVTAFLWGHLERAPAPVAEPARVTRRELMHRLHAHARVAAAMTRARAELQDVAFVPWRSKAAPPPGWREQRRALQLSSVLARHVRDGDAGTWSRSVLIELRVATGSAPLTRVRAGAPERFAAGQRVRVDRLDLLESSAGEVVLEHAELGRLTISADQQLSTWQLPALLLAPNDPARARIEQTITRALAGDERAALSLERTLVVTHAIVRAAVSANAAEPGAPRLRMILALFDDAVVRAREDPPSLAALRRP
ncbi:MAG: hypothetical protein H6713_26830 [Myxococcales bacterium]|nr:hypothetical protein [Myxococcales bacterium]